jgi:predicted DNA binding protein
VRWEIQRADPRLLNACKNFVEESWQEQIRTKRPDSGKPQCHTGPIASGDKVIAFGEILAQYRDVWPKLIGVEMEAAGVATATFQSSEKPGFFMVRCVSDLADEQKGSSGVEKWRPYACEAAASFVIALLKSGPVSLNENTNVIARKELPPNARRPEQLPTVQVTILLESDIQEFTPSERESFIFALSRIVNINPDQIRILRVAPGSVEVTLEMPEEAAQLLVSMYLDQEPTLKTLRIEKVELRPIIALPNELQILKQQQQQLIKKQDTILEAVQQARDAVLGRISAAYQDSVRVLLSALDEQEVHIVQAIVENADQNQLTDVEMEEILKAVRQGYKELQEKALPIFTSDTELQESENLSQAWKSPDISTGGKFKLSVPIIPKLLTYETELSISVKESLKKLWARFSRKE